MAKKLPDGWRTTYCAFIAEGYTHADAADATGVAAGTIRRHLQEDTELRDLYVEAREMVRDKVRNRIWAMGMQQGVDEVDAATTRWALDHLIKWNLPEARDTNRLEVDVTGEVTHKHLEGYTLADILQAGRSVPGLGLSARGELPAAGELLAESDESIAAPGDLPVRPAS